MSMFMYSYMHTQMWVFLFICAQACVHMEARGQPQVSFLRYLQPSFETGSLTGLEFIKQVKLAGQKVPGLASLCPLLPG